MNPTEYIITHCAEEKLATDEAPVWFLALWSIFEDRAFLGKHVRTKQLIKHTAAIDSNVISSKNELWPTIKEELRGIKKLFIELQRQAKFDKNVDLPEDLEDNNCKNNIDLLIAAILQVRNKVAHGQFFFDSEYDEKSLFIQINELIHLCSIVCWKWIRMMSLTSSR